MRDLVHSKAFDEGCLGLYRDARRLDEALRYPLWAVATLPDRFPLIPGTKIRRLRTNDFPGAPAVLIFFAVSDDDHRCDLLAIEKLTGEPEIRGTYTDQD